MKALIAITALALSLSAFSNVCTGILKDKELYDVRESKDFKTLVEKDIPFPKDMMVKAGQDPDVMDGCEKAVLQVMVHKKTNTTLKFIFTNEDECDGGNSYGYVTDSKNKILAAIGDSQFYCK